MKKGYRALYIITSALCIIVGSLMLLLEKWVVGLIFIALAAFFIFNSKLEKKDKQLNAEVKNQVAEEIGKMHVFKVKGVTFDNDNGESRQRILKQAIDSDEWESKLNAVEFEGIPAIEVLLDDKQIGYIGKNEVAEVMALLENAQMVYVDIEDFEDDDGKTIYRADVVIKEK